MTPFGLTGAPGCFQTFTNNIFRPYLYKCVLAYLDHIVVDSRTDEEHVKHLKTVLGPLKEHKLYGNLSKCTFLSQSIDYLGHVISKDVIQVNPKKFEAMKKWAAPQTVVQVQSFPGLCNDYRKIEKDLQ